MTAKIHANGIDITYGFDGPADKPVVMLSNSLLSNYSMWDGQIKALSANYRVLRYDQRGHGGTDARPGPYSIEMLAEDAYALTEALDIERVHFVGLSMGGFTAQILAVRHPEKLLSLALCDTACVMPPESVWNERIEIAETEGISALVDGTLERWFTPPFHESGKDELARVKRMILGTGVTGYVACCQAIRDMFLCAQLPQIKVPTVIMVGEKDPACPVSSAEVLNRGIAGSELIVIPESAHLPNIEQKAAFNAALTGFLDRQ